jgi:hypothetical protein
MSAYEARDYWDDWGLLLLWGSVLSGAAAWALNQLIGYALVKPSCAAGGPEMLLAVSGVTLAIALGGAWVAWSCLRKLRDADPTGGSRVDRSHLMAVGGVSLNLLIALLIVPNAVSQFLLSPCE